MTDGSMTLFATTSFTLLVIGNVLHAQNHDPCLRTSVHLYGDTIVTYYPNCADSATYTERRFSEGVIWRNESYQNGVPDGIHWYTGDQKSGSQAIHYEQGLETMRIYYHPNSGVPHSITRRLTDSTWHFSIYYASGNPEAEGHVIVDSLTHKYGTWIEYDEFDFGYSIGTYQPTAIYDTTLTESDYGEMMMKVQVIPSVYHGTWRKFDAAGSPTEERTYVMGVLQAIRKDE